MSIGYPILIHSFIVDTRLYKGDNKSINIYYYIYAGTKVKSVYFPR